MTLEQELIERSKHTCELCGAAGDGQIYAILPQPKANADNNVILCTTCMGIADRTTTISAADMGFLSGSIWSELPAIQVLSWRLLNRFKSESWASEQMEMLYLSDALLAWAKSHDDYDNANPAEVHKDSNGIVLQNGDSIVLTKSLDVKGSLLNAKMGTVVKNIRLVHDNTEQIEGKIEGQVIVILTKYVRKQGA